MNEALGLARKALGRTSPNPLVGAVLVKGRRVVGRGHHRRAGEKHAEIIALEKAGRDARGADLFINLEPCVHTGRTPPCVESLVRAEIGSATIGMVDPNPLVAGKGIERLRAAGIPVRVGVLESECQKLNAPFAKFITRGLPYVTLKIAATLDGKIATQTGDSRWVTSEKSREIVHRLRNRVDAIMVGVRTVLKDDPELTCRLAGGRDPARVILDSCLRTPRESKVLRNANGTRVFVVTKTQSDQTSAMSLRSMGVQLIEVSHSDGQLNLEEALRKLAKQEIVHIMIEGGSRVAASAIAGRLVDRLFLFYAPKLLGSEGMSMVGELGIQRMADALLLRETHWRRVGPDFFLEGYL